MVRQLLSYQGEIQINSHGIAKIGQGENASTWCWEEHVKPALRVADFLESNFLIWTKQQKDVHFLRPDNTMVGNLNYGTNLKFGLIFKHTHLYFRILYLKWQHTGIIINTQ